MIAERFDLTYDHESNLGTRKDTASAAAHSRAGHARVRPQVDANVVAVATDTDDVLKRGQLRHETAALPIPIGDTGLAR